MTTRLSEKKLKQKQFNPFTTPTLLFDLEVNKTK